MSDKYIGSTLLGDVSVEEITAVAPEYEAFCKALWKEWSAKPSNLPSPGAWDGNTWFNQMEGRERRWKEHLNHEVHQWWASKGYDIEIARSGALTISRPVGTAPKSMMM